MGCGDYVRHGKMPDGDTYQQHMTALFLYLCQSRLGRKEDFSEQYANQEMSQHSVTKQRPQQTFL